MNGSRRVEDLWPNKLARGRLGSICNILYLHCSCPVSTMALILDGNSEYVEHI